MSSTDTSRSQTPPGDLRKTATLRSTQLEGYTNEDYQRIHDTCRDHYWKDEPNRRRGVISLNTLSSSGVPLPVDDTSKYPPGFGLGHGWHHQQPHEPIFPIPSFMPPGFDRSRGFLGCAPTQPANHAVDSPVENASSQGFQLSAAEPEQEDSHIHPPYAEHVEHPDGGQVGVQFVDSETEYRAKEETSNQTPNENGVEAIPSLPRNWAKEVLARNPIRRPNLYADKAFKAAHDAAWAPFFQMWETQDRATALWKQQREAAADDRDTSAIPSAPSFQYAVPANQASESAPNLAPPDPDLSHHMVASTTPPHLHRQQPPSEVAEIAVDTAAPSMGQHSPARGLETSAETMTSPGRPDDSATLLEKSPSVLRGSAPIFLPKLSLDDIYTLPQRCDSGDQVSLRCHSDELPRNLSRSSAASSVYQDSRTRQFAHQNTSYCDGEEDEEGFEEPKVTVEAYDETPHNSRYRSSSAWSEHESFQSAPEPQGPSTDHGYDRDDGDDYSWTGPQMEKNRARLRALERSNDNQPDSSMISPMLGHAGRQMPNARPKEHSPALDKTSRNQSSRPQRRPPKSFVPGDRSQSAKTRNRKQAVDEFTTRMAQLDFDKDGGDNESEPFQPTSSPQQRQIPDRSNVDGIEQEHDVVCAISESRAANVNGMAVIDLTLGQANISRIVNNDGYRTMADTLWKLQHRPHTFVVLKNALNPENKDSALASMLKKEFPDVAIVTLDRSYWREEEGFRMIQRYAWKQDEAPLRANLENNFYASCAWAAAMVYVEAKSSVKFLPNSIHVTYAQPSNVMGLDRATISSLELLQNTRRTKAGPTTLFGVLNTTLTPGGRRLLRSTLLQPSTDETVITERWDAVQELSSSQNFFNDVRETLKKLMRIDIEQVMSTMAKHPRNPRQPIQAGFGMIRGARQMLMAAHEELQAAEKDLNQILMIKTYLQGILAVYNTLDAAECTSRLCERAKRKCAPRYVEPILSLINQTIEEDVVYSKQPVDIKNNRLWAVKAGANCILAGARQYYRFRIEELQSHVDRMNVQFEEQLGCKPQLVLGNDNHYRLKFQWSDVEKQVRKQARGFNYKNVKELAGMRIVNAERKKKHFLCQTTDMIKRSMDIQYHADVVTQQSDVHVTELKMRLLDKFSFLHTTAEAVAILDMMCSFAHLASTQNYVRPIFANTMALRQSRHPVVELRMKEYVANDVFSGDKELRFAVVTGCNMSGKSTYVKSIALSQILAQIGCFVPANEASISICDRIFTRLSTEDKPENNLGTFAVEMTEMSTIINQATDRSMVVIDELGRGTSTKEGFAIALAMCEDLIRKGPRVFFVTHFTEIGQLLNASSPRQVLNVHLVARSETVGQNVPRVSLPHRVASGPVRDRDYGIHLARRELPAPIIENAELVSGFLGSRKGVKLPAPASRKQKIERTESALLSALRQIVYSPLDDAEVANRADQLQDELRYKLANARDDEPLSPAANHPAATSQKPVLKKLSEEERRGWREKCKEAEERIMYANRAGLSKEKRPEEISKEDWSKKRRREEEEEQARRKKYKRAEGSRPPQGKSLKELKEWFLERARRVGKK